MVTLAIVILVSLGNIAMGYVMGRTSRPRRAVECRACLDRQGVEAYGWRPARDQWPVYQPPTEPGSPS